MATKTLVPHHLSKLSVHKGDMVRIIAGKDKGEEGRVERTFPRSKRVIVEGKNIVKRHLRAGGPARQSGIIEKSMPLHASNVMVVCTNCGKPTRIGHERVPQGADQRIRTRRVCKHCNQAIQEQTRTVGG